VHLHFLVTEGGVDEAAALPVLMEKCDVSMSAGIFPKIPRIDDPTLADAILDRLVRNAYKIELKGESMRKIMKSLTQSGHSGT
jgi:hypothetical protein